MVSRRDQSQTRADYSSHPFVDVFVPLVFFFDLSLLAYRQPATDRISMTSASRDDILYHRRTFKWWGRAGKTRGGTSKYEKYLQIGIPTISTLPAFSLVFVLCGVLSLCLLGSS